MKKTIIFILMILWGYFVNGQTEGECPNLNSFLQSEDLDDLKYFTDTIFPYGTMLFDIGLLNDYGGIEEILALLDVETGTTFEFEDEYESQFDDDMWTLRFQQFHEGTKVDGGGYAMVIYGSSGPGGPCDVPYMLAPNILTDIDIGVDPTVGEGELDKIIKDEEGIDYGVDINLTYELNISHDLLDNCNYILTWRVMYSFETVKESWVDAQTGEVLKTIKSTKSVNAPTEHFGEVNLDDTYDGSNYILENSKVKTFYFGDDKIEGVGDYNSSLIPTTPPPKWNESNASKHAFQSHFVTTEVCSFLQDIKIEFDIVHLGVTDSQDQIPSSLPSNKSNPHIIISRPGGFSWGHYQTIGHELGHSYLDRYVNYWTVPTQGLHEGLADMIGTYVDYLKTGVIHWKQGYVIDQMADSINRDLQNPHYHTYQEIQNFTWGDAHKIGVPLGYWFYLITEGKVAINIPALGIEKAINIVIEAIKKGGVTGYPKLRELVIAYVQMKYGKCSDEMISVMNAWHKIGLGAYYNGCEFRLTGPNYACEEAASFRLCASGGALNNHYRWSIIGPNCSQWNTDSGSGCTIEADGSCLVFEEWPEYPYYPQYFTIKVYSPTAGGAQYSTQKKQFVLKDCNHNKSTCEEYFGNSQILNSEEKVVCISKREVVKIIIFDMMGNVLYEGDEIDINNHSFSHYTGVIFLASFDNNNELIIVEKNLIFNGYK